MALDRIIDLPEDSAPTGGDYVPIDNSSPNMTRRTRVDDLLSSAGAGVFATAAQGATADTALQPADIGVSVGNMLEATYDPSGQGQNAYDQKYRNDSPVYYGATGNGTTVDTTDYQAAEAVQDTIFLPTGSVFNLDTDFPAKPVYGPGSLKLSGATLSGFDMKVDAYRSTIFMTPTDYTDAVGFPSAGYNKNVVIGTGASVQGVMNRSVFIGSMTSHECVTIDRSIGIGDGAMEFTGNAERHVAVGTANSQWLGATEAMTVATHPWWIDAGGFTPGQVGWDFGGMETRNPGVGADIDAFTAYATAATDCGRSVAVGRDAIGGNVIALNDVAIGYRALAGYNTEGNVAVGNDAFYQGVFITQSVAIGKEAGRYWQEGQRNVVVGRGAADDVVRGSYNTVLGSFAGSTPADLNDSVLIGYAAANAISGTSQSDIFVLGNRNRNYLMTGNFSTGQMGIGVGLLPADLKGSSNGSLHIQNSSFGATEAANAAVDDFIIESGGSSTGMTIRSAAAALGALAFARPGQSVRGLFQYDHAADAFNHIIASTTRFQVGNGVIVGTGGSFLGAGTLNVIADIYRGGTKVVGARDTGWTAMTGTADEATAYATGTVTLPQLAGRVMALQAALTTHGLIGA